MFESFILAALAIAPQRIPVVPASAAPASFLCNSAVVRGSNPAQVRDRPEPRARATHALPPGTRLFVCDEARGRNHQRWLGVAYAKRGKPCAGGTSKGLPVRLASHCRSGWVRRDQIEVLSG
jgi:hypothetical protein